MPLRNTKPHTFRARGCSDAVDGTNAFPGAMQALQNLVPSPGDGAFFVPRPASTSLTTFASFTSPAQINALLTVGNIVYGMIAETGGGFNGKDVPFAFNLLTSTFQTITIPGGTASLPTTPATTGDWTPPSMAVVGTRVCITHPGYAGGAIKFGWLDISGFTSTGITGTTHSTTTIDTLSSNVLTAGWQPGMTITGTNIPANTTIVSIASNGLSIVMSAAATDSVAGKALTVAGGTFTAPLYGSGDTNGNNLIAVPTCVAQFNGRAWFGTNSGSTVGVQFTDSGNASQITNASQALTFKNGINVTALGGLPLTSSTQGGIVQALIVFQGDANMVQIQGDAATSNLTANTLGVGVGTLAPNTICVTTQGLAFVAPDGVRIIDFLARVSEPIGDHGKGVVQPFINASNPSRMCAAFNQNIIRISVANAGVVNTPVQEWWYDFEEKIWTGPHSFPAALIEPNQSSTQGFVVVASGINATLWQSATVPSLTSTFVENSVQMTWTWITTLMPDNDEMAENAVVESTLGLLMPVGQTVAAQATDEAGNVLGQTSITQTGIAPAKWGTAVWGSFLWGAAGGYFVQHPLLWPNPLVFKQVQFQANGQSTLGFAIGNLYLRRQTLGYQTQAAS